MWPAAQATAFAPVPGSLRLADSQGFAPTSLVACPSLVCGIIGTMRCAGSSHRPGLPWPGCHIFQVLFAMVITGAAQPHRSRVLTVPFPHSHTSCFDHTRPSSCSLHLNPSVSPNNPFFFALSFKKEGWFLHEKKHTLFFFIPPGSLKPQDLGGNSVQLSSVCQLVAKPYPASEIHS